MVASINGGFAVTAGVEQTRVSGVVSVRPEKAEIIDKQTQIASAASIDEDNTTSIERNRINNSERIDVPRDAIRVSSTLGRSALRGSLTESRAIELYEKIARLL